MKIPYLIKVIFIVTFSMNCGVDLQFMVGDVVALFEEDIPERPELLSVTGGNDQLTVSWKEYDAYATDQAPSLTGVRIAFKSNGSGGWKYKDLTASDTLASGNLDIGSYVLTTSDGIKDSTTYTVKVAHVDNNNTFRYNYSTKKDGTTT